MAFEDLLKGIIEFQHLKHEPHAKLFKALSKGQAPDSLMIACSDSRLVPNFLTDSGPGDLFITRNAGNFVPANQPGAITPAEATLAALEYGVLALNVRHIIVCGHSDCGAMKALLNGAPDTLPAVSAWLKHGDEALKESSNELCALTQKNIEVQIRHLRSHPYIAEREGKGALSLHGWFYDIATGDILALEPHSGAFIPAREFYRDQIPQ